MPMRFNLKVCHKTICIILLKAQTPDEVDDRLGHAVGTYLLMQSGSNQNLTFEIDVFKRCVDKRKQQLTKNKVVRL